MSRCHLATCPHGAECVHAKPAEASIPTATVVQAIAVLESVFYEKWNGQTDWMEFCIRQDRARKAALALACSCGTHRTRSGDRPR